MSEAGQQQANKHLASVAFSLKQLVKVMEAMNENLVVIGKRFQNLCDLLTPEDEEESETAVPWGPLRPQEVTLEDAIEARKIYLDEVSSPETTTQEAAQAQDAYLDVVKTREERNDASER
jgi:hypothetical protein